MFHTEDRAAGKDKSLTFSRGPKGCHGLFPFFGGVLLLAGANCLDQGV